MGGVGQGHFDINFRVTPTLVRLGEVNLRFGWSLTIKAVYFHRHVYLVYITNVCNQSEVNIHLTEPVFGKAEL